MFPSTPRPRRMWLGRPHDRRFLAETRGVLKRRSNAEMGRVGAGAQPRADARDRSRALHQIAPSLLAAAILFAAGATAAAAPAPATALTAALVALGAIVWLIRTPVKAADATLRLHEAQLAAARFRDIVEIAAELIWETDAQHRFTSVIGDARNVIRRADGRNFRAIGKTRWELAHADIETDPLWRAHKADLDARRPFHQFRYRRSAPGGPDVHFSVSGKPIFDQVGNFVGYRGTASVETEIIAAQERAQRADALLRDAVNCTAAGFVIYDAEDRFYLCNQAYRDFYPSSATAMIPGARFEDILRAGLAGGQHPEAAGREAEWLADRVAKHRQLREEHEQRLQDGRWVLVSERRMPTGGTAGLRIDITALKKVQASLRDSQAQLNEAQRVANTGSAVHDFRTNKTAWSDQLYRIFGLSREGDSPGLGALLALVHPDDRERVQAAVKTSFGGHASPSIHYRILRPDGSLRWVYREARINFAEDGSPLLLTSTFKDITEQRLAEERHAELEGQLHHSQRLEALGTLAGGIAHDLNNTLVPILALSKLALQLLPADSPVRGDLATVVAASEQARDLVRQILAFSRKQGLDKREIDLRAVTRDALAMLRASLPATVRLVDALEDVPPVLGDAGQLQQVMVNLVANAAHAIGDAIGTITVTLAPTGDTARSEIKLAVTDTGCGIEAAHLDRIFEPFFTTKPVSEGTGLGLAVVHGIVAGHDGTIEVQSAVGKGTEISILLPAIRERGAVPDVSRSAA
jgi:PAS domain S-box-containing protein